eukprot:COSAG05_NODE_4084_length_1681_cov_1.415297_1_plen_170_part_00
MLRALTSVESAKEVFAEDVVLHVLAHRQAQAERNAAADKDVDNAVHTGRRDPSLTSLNEYALRTTMAIVKRAEQWARNRGKKILYVLSYGAQEFYNLLDGFRFDDALLQWFQAQQLPFVDLLEAHRQDFGSFSCSAEEYARRYWVGHYSPLGNFFCGWAILPKLLELMG